MGVSLPLGFSPSNTPANTNLDAIVADIVTLQGAASVVPGGGRTVTQLGTYLANNAVFNVKDFGAKGDGVTDDTAAINAGAAAAVAVGGTIVIPPATYQITGDILLSGPCTLVADCVTINSTAGRMRVPSAASRVVMDGCGTSTFNFVNGDPALSLDRAFRIEGAYNGSLLGISAPIAAGDSHFVATNAGDAAGLVKNQWVYVNEYDGGQMRAEWKQVLSVVGTTVNVTSPFRRGLSLYTLGFFIITPNEDVVIRGWEIVTTGVAVDNYGVDAELGRNFRLENCRFKIARGMAWQVYWQDAPTITNCTVDQQVGRRSSVGACTDFYFGHLRFGAQTAFPTDGAMSFETACAYGVAEDLIAYGHGGSGIFAVQIGSYIDFIGCVGIGDGATIGLFVLGGEGIRSIGCRFFNVLDGVRYDSNSGFTPNFPAIANASISDIVRTATNGVYVRSPATQSSILFLDTDSSVGTPVLDSGTNTLPLNRVGTSGALALPSGSTISQQLQLTGAPTSVTQMLLGSSSTFGAVGTRFSGGDSFLCQNASSALGSDLWTQSNAAAASLLILLTNNGSISFYSAVSGTAAAIFATFWTLIGTIDVNHFVNMAGAGGVKVGNVQVVGARRTGWTAQTTTPARADMGATPSLATVYATLAALIDDLTSHGLIGP